MVFVAGGRLYVIGSVQGLEIAVFDTVKYVFVVDIVLNIAVRLGSPTYKLVVFGDKSDVE